MWKITALAIRESPVQGVGLGGFPAAYAQAQMDYFKSGIGSETENRSPEVPNTLLTNTCEYFSNRAFWAASCSCSSPFSSFEVAYETNKSVLPEVFFNIIRFCLCLLSLLFMGISGNVGTAWLGLRFKNRESSSKEKKQSETFIILFYF